MAGARTRSDYIRTMRSGWAAVHAQQRQLWRTLLRYGARPFASLDTVANALLVRLPDDQAAAVKSLPGVRRVYPVYRVHASLERAIPRHRAPEAWARLGGEDLAGAGAKIAIIDTGIDPAHPGMIDPSIPMPEGFPRVNRAADLAFTSNKVIVARSYLSLLSGAGDISARDKDGHGTAVAVAAAGVLQQTADGPISGVAPKAYVGNYTVFPATGDTRADIVLKAIDDAARDGMDVINLSLGSPFALRPKDDIFTRIVRRLNAAGVLVVAAAGNSGPDRFTISDTAVAPETIAVGASWNDRTLSGTVQLATGQQYDAVPGDGVKPLFPVTAPLFDVSQLDSDGLACGPLPAGSLQGRIAFILRGTCFFEDKLNNAQAAGAVAALLYTHAVEPQPVIMSVGSATLAGLMVSHADGLEIKSLLEEATSLSATLNFRVLSEVDPNRIASFSSRGPGTDLAVKPDLVATGVALNTATLNGGYDTTQGTSFSAPLVAGAAAVLKAARPGYPGDVYRSLLINTADPLVFASGSTAPVQQAGAGLLDLDAALAATVTVYPTAVSFGSTTGALSRRLTISNLGTEAAALTLSTQPFGGGPPPVLSETAVAIGPMRTHGVTLTVAPEGLPAGEYQGFVWIHGSRPGADVHVPYWYAVPSGTPAQLTIVDHKEEAKAGALVRRAISVRTTDAAGLPLRELKPEVTVVSGGGEVLSVFSDDATCPGLFEVDIRMGPSPGDNVFRIEAGGLSDEVTIQGQ